MPPRPSRSKLPAVASSLPDAAGVLAALPEAVLVLDPAWRVSWANPAAQALLGEVQVGADARSGPLGVLGLAQHLDMTRAAGAVPGRVRFSHRPASPAR